MNETNEEANKTHDGKANRRGCRNFEEFFPVRFVATTDEANRICHEAMKRLAHSFHSVHFCAGRKRSLDGGDENWRWGCGWWGWRIVRVATMANRSSLNTDVGDDDDEFNLPCSTCLALAPYGNLIRFLDPAIKAAFRNTFTCWLNCDI